MPAYKCNNGKWKFGQTGSCKYDSKAEAENDNKDYYRAVSDIDLTPTQGMIDEAKMGLMAMHTEGYIHDIEVEKEESDSEESSSDDVSTKDSSPEEGEETSVQEEIETPEGNIIEVAEVVVEEDPKKKSRGIFGINSTPKIVY